MFNSYKFITFFFMVSLRKARLFLLGSELDATDVHLSDSTKRRPLWRQIYLGGVFVHTKFLGSSTIRTRSIHN